MYVFGLYVKDSPFLHFCSKGWGW